MSLLQIHDRSDGPAGDRWVDLRRQRDPDVAGTKAALEDDLLGRLVERSAERRATLPDGAAGMREVAAIELVPSVYRWLQDRATWDELVAFLAIEGGPDAGFDDLVAVAQVGISGDAKLALAENYWDEMGRGSARAVHTELHRDLVRAVDMPRIPRESLPTSALERSVLSGLLSTNRGLQPELIGALGLLEMQAGPRCRCVVRAMRRLEAPPEALAFYEEHAEADPHHGKAWVDRVVEPLAGDGAWASRMVDGALWRHEINHRFFGDLARRFDRPVRTATRTPALVG